MRLGPQPEGALAYLAGRIRASASRRRFLKVVAASSGGLGLVAIPGCGYYAAESCGEAYAPWNFPDPEFEVPMRFVHAAILAASPHNTQPWRFDVSAKRIDVFADFSRNLGAMDGLRRELHIGLGCAIENLVVAARAHGQVPTVELLPDASDPSLVARVELEDGDAQDEALYLAIPERHTNRGLYLESGPPDGLEDALRSLVEDPKIELTFLSSARDKATFKDGTVRATRAIVADTEMNEAGHAWWRQTCEDIAKYRDGLTLDASGNDAFTRFAGKVAGAPSAEAAGGYWISLTEGQQTTASAFAILSSRDRDSRPEQLLAGRAFQRIHLWATQNGLGMQPLNQMAERQDREIALDLPADFSLVLRKLLGSDELGAQMLFRIGYPWDAAIQSPRRSIRSVKL